MKYIYISSQYFSWYYVWSSFIAHQIWHRCQRNFQ